MSDQYGTVLAAAEALLSAAGLSASRRERPVFDPDRDSLPLLMTVQEKVQPRGGTFGGTVFFGYPVLVVYLEAGDLQAADAASQAAYRAVLEAIRKALFVTTLAAAPAVWDCEYEPDVVVALEGLDRAARVGAQRFTFVTAEDRN